MNEQDILAKGYKKYYGKEINVYFNLDICTHVAACIKLQPEVFDINRRPWILPDAGEVPGIIQVCEVCPSKALKYRLVDSDEVLPK